MREQIEGGKEETRDGKGGNGRVIKERPKWWPLEIGALFAAGRGVAAYLKGSATKEEVPGGG